MMTGILTRLLLTLAHQAAVFSGEVDGSGVFGIVDAATLALVRTGIAGPVLLASFWHYSCASVVDGA